MPPFPNLSQFVSKVRAYEVDSVDSALMKCFDGGLSAGFLDGALFVMVFAESAKVWWLKAVILPALELFTLSSQPKPPSIIYLPNVWS